MPTRSHRERGRKPSQPVIVAEWRGELPDYIHWLHNSATREHMADEYAAGHIAGFKITPTDLILVPDLKGMDMVYLVYRVRETNRDQL